MCFFLMFQKNNWFLGPKVWPVVRSQTDGHTHRMTTGGTLSGFQDCFLQPIIKDWPDHSDTMHVYSVQFKLNHTNSVSKKKKFKWHRPSFHSNIKWQREFFLLGMKSRKCVPQVQRMLCLCHPLLPKYKLYHHFHKLIYSCNKLKKKIFIHLDSKFHRLCYVITLAILACIHNHLYIVLLLL